MWAIQSECVGHDWPVRYFWIPNFDYAYVIGDDGSLWTRYQGRGRNCYLSNEWTKRNPTPDSEGYLCGSISVNRIKYMKLIHQLVCEAVWGTLSSRNGGLS